MADRESSFGDQRVNGARLSGNVKGALLMIVSGVGFTIYLLMNKLLSGDVHPVFLAFWRAFFGMAMAIPFVLRRGIGIMRTRRPGMLLVRSLFGTFGFTLAIIAVSQEFTLPWAPETVIRAELTLAQFNAISFTRPLFVTILAALVLREIVGVQRWLAVAVGFVGVLVMVMPGALLFWQAGAFDGLGFNLGSGMALASAFSLAAAIVMVKFLSGELAPIALLLYANALSCLLLGPFLLVFWTEVSLSDWGWIIFMSAMAFISQFCFISAMKVGDASFLSPIDYVRLPMSAVADFAVFRLVPTINVWLGAIIIVASTLFISLRERRRALMRSRDPH